MTRALVLVLLLVAPALPGLAAGQVPCGTTLGTRLCPDLVVDGLKLGESVVETQTFGYVQPDRDGEAIELSPEPSWNRVAYVPR